MSFLDSQLAGVIVGGIIGGLGKILYDYNKNRKLKQNLKNGIRTEIKVLKDALESGLKQYKDYLEQIETHGKIKTLFAPMGDFRLNFLERNLEKIGILDKNILEPIVEINGTLVIFADGLMLLYKSANEVFEGKGSVAIVKRQIRIAIATFKGLIESSDKVLQPEKKLIPSLLERFKNKSSL